jgi:hypothetical protein
MHARDVNAPALPRPARYFPAAGGKYRIEPGLSKFGKDFGNGAADGHVFQVDSNFAVYHAAKLAARAERLDKYFQTDRFSDEVAGAAARFIVRRLASEHPQFFTARAERDGLALDCRLTGETLHFSEHLRLLEVSGRAVAPPYRGAFDALASQLQEDLAVINGEALRAVHLCFPNHWAAEDKVGHSFAEVHEPVAGIEPVNRRADHLVRTMLGATDGLVRFAWGVTVDPRLNHHPRPGPGETPALTFDPAHPKAHVRVERQTMWGLPGVGAALFLIRTYVLDCDDLTPQERSDLAAAVESMTPESLTYKGLASSKDPLLTWLRPPSPLGGRGQG